MNNKTKGKGVDPKTIEKLVSALGKKVWYVELISGDGKKKTCPDCEGEGKMYNKAKKSKVCGMCLGSGTIPDFNYKKWKVFGMTVRNITFYKDAIFINNYTLFQEKCFLTKAEATKEATKRNNLIKDKVKK